MALLKTLKTKPYNPGEKEKVPVQTDDEGTPGQATAVQNYLTRKYNKRDSEGYPKSARANVTDGDEVQALARIDARKEAIREQFSKEGITLKVKPKKGK